MSQGANESFQLEPRADSRFAAVGSLTFGTARNARALGLRLLKGLQGDVVVDCAGVTRGDSAGLAVLLDWLGAARAGGQGLRYEGLPRQIIAIAEISEVDELLTGAV